MPAEKQASFVRSSGRCENGTGEGEAEVRVGRRLFRVPPRGPGKVDQVVGVSQEPVHRYAGPVVGILGHTGRQEVDRPAVHLTGSEPGSGKHAVGAAEGTVEHDERVVVIGGPDEHVRYVYE